VVRGGSCQSVLLYVLCVHCRHEHTSERRQAVIKPIPLSLFCLCRKCSRCCMLCVLPCQRQRVSCPTPNAGRPTLLHSSSTLEPTLGGLRSMQQQLAARSLRLKVRLSGTERGRVLSTKQLCKWAAALIVVCCAPQRALRPTNQFSPSQHQTQLWVPTFVWCAPLFVPTHGSCSVLHCMALDSASSKKKGAATGRGCLLSWET